MSLVDEPENLFIDSLPAADYELGSEIITGVIDAIESALKSGPEAIDGLGSRLQTAIVAEHGDFGRACFSDAVRLLRWRLAFSRGVWPATRDPQA